MINQLRYHSSRIWRGFWDKLGIGLSGLCVIHCLLTPILIATLPLWPEFLGLWEWAHPLFALVLIPTTWFAVRDAYTAGRPKSIMILLTSGLIVILSALLWHEADDLIGETVVSVIGSALLITGHFINYKAGKACDLPIDNAN